MPNRNAPLSVEGLRRLIGRCHTRPICQVAAEMGNSQANATKWVRRWRRHGDLGLQDRSNAPGSSPAGVPAAVIARIERLRCDEKHSARRIVVEFVAGMCTSRRTVTRMLDEPLRSRRRGQQANFDGTVRQDSIDDGRPL